MTTEPMSGAVTLSPREMWEARQTGTGPTVTTEDTYEVAGDAGGRISSEDTSTVTHQSGGLIVMYKKESWGSRPYRVPRNSMRELMAAGYSDVCHDCGGQHNELPNACPGRAPFAYRVCPQDGCGKKFYDLNGGADDLPASEDENLIRDDSYKASTPESRTRQQMNQHVRWYHESLAYDLGLMSAATAVEGVR